MTVLMVRTLAILGAAIFVGLFVTGVCVVGAAAVGLVRRPHARTPVATDIRDGARRPFTRPAAGRG